MALHAKKDLSNYKAANVTLPNLKGRPIIKGAAEFKYSLCYKTYSTKKDLSAHNLKGKFEKLKKKQPEYYSEQEIKSVGMI